jgi:hypothetical protein
VSNDTPATCAGSKPKLSRVTMYAPPAVGYSLIVSRYERIKKKRTTIIATVMGSTRLNAKMPAAGIRTRRISSVAYADDEMQSDEKTASAVGMPRRSCSSADVLSGGPRRRFFQR